MASQYKNLFNITAVIIVIVALALAVGSVWNDSPIVDEIPHIGAGYSYIATGDHRLNPEHPPLAKDLAGISLKILGINDQPAFESTFWQTDINGQWEFGRKLIFGSGNDAIRLVRFTKIPQLTFFILITVVIFLWTRKLYGRLAALIAIFLFSFSPTILAHSRFVTTDIPALFGVMLATCFFLHYLERPTKINLLIAGLAFGVAQLTKFSVFLLVPFFLVLAVIYAFLNYSKSKLLSTFIIIAVGYIFVVWPVYYLHTWNYPPDLQRYHTDDLLKSSGNRQIADTVVYLSDKPVIRALAEYGLGLVMVSQRSSGGNTAYFMGEIRNWAWPEYFPIVYFLKEPLAFWCLIILAFLALLFRVKIHSFKYAAHQVMRWSKNNFTELAMLLWIAIYWYVSIRSNLNIGIRHMIPVYGFTFILLAGQLTKIVKKINSKKLVIGYWLLVVGLSGWYLYENVSVYPYYLTYFNQAAGGSSGGYRYVVDSNLDWGQDLKRLADWVNKNNIQKIYLDYFGWADQNYYLGDKVVWTHAGDYKSYGDFLTQHPEGGYLAVSATYYMGSRDNPENSYAWLDAYKPTIVIGNSIFVWHITP